MNPALAGAGQGGLRYLRQRRNDAGAGAGCDAQKRSSGARPRCACTPGDPCLYGAIREQMDALDSRRHPLRRAPPACPAFCGAAAALNAEYTLPGVSQSCHHHPHGGPHPGARGRAAWPAWPSHGATMVHFPVHWSGGQSADRAFAGGLHRGDPRRRGLQGHLAGAKDRATAPWAPWPPVPRADTTLPKPR